MFRQIATVIDVADVIGGFGIAFIAICALLYDPRLALGVVGGFLLLLAIALASGRVTPPPAPPAGE